MSKMKFDQKGLIENKAINFWIKDLYFTNQILLIALKFFRFFFALVFHVM